MKKLFGCLLFVMLVFCLSGPLSASPYPADEFLDSTILYPPNKSDLDEQAWLEGFVGDGPLVHIATINFADGPKLIEGYDPGIGGWTYAIVKIGQGGHDEDWLFAYLDMPDGTDPPGLDNLLTVADAGSNTYDENGFIRGVSHMQFFGPHSVVPEPATLFLLGLGIFGIAGLGRKFKK